MIKTLTAYTSEVDDEQLAIEHIMEQLQLETALLRNSIGIVACHYEFVISGVAQAVCNALPFNVAGTISNTQSIGRQSAALLLTIMVITSDEVEFDMVLTPSLLQEPGKVITESYTATALAKPEKPALILTFAPFMVLNSGDEYVASISEASGGVPCFGTLAVDDTSDFANCYSICNDEYYSDRMVMVLVYGNISPKFYIANISNDKILDKTAVVTKSSGHIVMEINGRSVANFIESLGLTKASATQYAMSSLPFLIDYNDGSPWVAKIFLQMTEEGYAMFASAVPEGSTLHPAMASKDDVYLTTGQAMEQILQELEGASGLLIYSCVSRVMAIGGDQLAEMNFVNSKLDSKAADRLPIMMAYSGGEICPTQISGAGAVNRFHNNTFVACLF